MSKQKGFNAGIALNRRLAQAIIVGGAAVVVGLCAYDQGTGGISWTNQLMAYAGNLAGGDNTGMFMTNSLKTAVLGEHKNAVYTYTPGATAEFEMTVDVPGATVEIYNAETGDPVEMTEVIEGSTIADESDAEEETGTEIQFNLQQDTLYNIVVSAPDAEEDSEANIGIAKLTEPELIDDEVTIKVGETTGVEFDDAEDIGSITWKVGDESICTVDENGVITALSSGKTTLIAHVTDVEGIEYDTTIEITVSRPLITDYIELNVASAADADGYLPLKDDTENNQILVTEMMPDSTISAEVEQEGLEAIVDYDGQDTASISLKAKKEGLYTVHTTINGEVYTSKVNVFSGHITPVLVNPDTKESVAVADEVQELFGSDNTTLLYADSKISFEPDGFPDNSTVTWSTDNTDIATIDDKGVLTCVGTGDVVVTASYNGTTAGCRIRVVKKEVVLAINYAFEHYDSTYSQPNRMAEGYYDCSSYVWRSYAYAGLYLGGVQNYAPTAAGMAQLMVQQGCQVFQGGSSTSELLPGDLIFWTGASNGRYLGIYHVDMYVGNGQAITVHRTKTIGGVLPQNCFAVRPYFNGDEADSVGYEKALSQYLQGLSSSTGTTYSTGSGTSITSTVTTGTGKKTGTTVQQSTEDADEQIDTMQSQKQSVSQSQKQTQSQSQPQTESQDTEDSESDHTSSGAQSGGDTSGNSDDTANDTQTETGLPDADLPK